MYTLICTILLAAFAGLDWNYIVHDSPARIVVVAGTLCTILQLVKRYLPAVNGWLAVALNLTLSASGILAITRPDQIWTIATWQNVFVTSLAAAGIHGTTKLMRDPDASATQALQARRAVTLMLAFAIGLIGLSLTGCTDWEREAFKSISASKAVIDQAQADYQSGKIPQNDRDYTIITKAKQVQNTAVDGLEMYEHLREAKGTDQQLSAQQAAVTELLGQLPALIVDVRALYTAPTTKQ